MLLYDRILQAVSRPGRAQRIDTAGRPHHQVSNLLDQRAAQFLATHNLWFIRISLATIYLWFGALKIVGPTSNFDLVADTLFWFPVPPDILVPFLGMGEIVLAFGLLFGMGMVLRASLFLFFCHMAGTFLVLVVLPDVAFREGNPFLLTKIGEYVIKNIVFVAAGLALLASAGGLAKGK